MMSWLVLCVDLLLLVISLKIYAKKPMNPMILFLALWGFIIFLSCLNLYGMDKASNETWILMLSMILFFFLGSVVQKSGRVLVNQNRIFKNKHEMRKKLFVFLTILIFGALFYNCFEVMKYIMKGIPLWQIRNWSLEAYGADSQNGRSFLGQLIKVLILDPFAAIFFPFVAYYFLNPKKNKYRKGLLILSLIYLILSSLSSGGGRLAIVCYVFYFLLAYITFAKKSIVKKINVKKYKKAIITFAIIGVVAVCVLSTLRNGAGTFLREIYIYFALPPTLFDKWLPELQKGQHTYGMLTFFGVHSYFFRFFEAVGLKNLVPNVYNVSYKWILNAELWKNVGSGINNAFVTPIFYFYKDGGILFVCLFSFVFGWLTQMLYRKFTKRLNVGSFILYSLVMYGVFVSFMRAQTCIPSYWISFIMTYYLFNYKYDKEDRI